MKHTLKLAAAILIMAVALGACDMETEADPTKRTEAATQTGTETVQKQTPLLDTTWSLVEIQSMDDSIGTVTPPEGQTFSVRLTADGRAAVQADCNRGGGGYEHAGSSLEFGPMAMTKMYCGPDSLDGRFLQELGFVRSYVLKDGKLFMATMADGAILEFAAGGEPD